MNLMVICTGNTCRSPMGEGILRQLLRERSREDVLVESAGLSAFEGDAPSEHAVEALEEIGIDISGHRSRRPSPAELSAASRIYVMTAAHRRSLELLQPELQLSLHACVVALYGQKQPHVQRVLPVLQAVHGLAAPDQVAADTAVAAHLGVATRMRMRPPAE